MYYLQRLLFMVLRMLGLAVPFATSRSVPIRTDKNEGRSFQTGEGMRCARWKRGSVCSVCLFVTLLAIPALGQRNRVSVRATSVNRSMWVSNALYRIKKIGGLEATALARYVQLEYQNNPQIAPEVVINNLKAAEDAFQQRYSVDPNIQKSAGLTEFDATNAMYSILCALPKVDIRNALAAEQASWALKYAPTGTNAQDILLAQAGQYYSYVSAEHYKINVLTSLHKIAGSNAQAAQAVDAFFGPIFNALTSDTASVIVSNT